MMQKKSRIIPLRSLLIGFVISIVGSTSAVAGPTAEEYAADVPGSKIIAAKQLRIDGIRIDCGSSPTVLAPTLDDYAAAFPGFVILNPTLLGRVSTSVKLWIYASACVLASGGLGSDRADCLAIQRGRKQGWLGTIGLNDVCQFIRLAKADTAHKSGPERCAIMRRCYADQTFRPAQIVKRSRKKPKSEDPHSKHFSWERYSKRRETLLEQVLNYTLSATLEGSPSSFSVSNPNGIDKCEIKFVNRGWAESINIEKIDLRGFRIRRVRTVGPRTGTVYHNWIVGDERTRIVANESGQVMERLQKAWRLAFQQCPSKIKAPF